MALSQRISTLLLLLSFAWVLAAGPVHNSRNALHQAAVALRAREDVSHDSLTMLRAVRNHFPVPSKSYTSVTNPESKIKQAYQLKYLGYHQQAVIVATALGASMIRAFWLKVARDALYHRNFQEQPKELITFTQGRFQATFSCLGQALPWTTIHDIAMDAAGAVRDGWIDTFDAVYEQDLTGFTVWASVSVLGTTLGTGKGKDPAYEALD